MAVEITMPALSPTMEEGNLAKWLVKEGDSVAAGDVIAEIETDKATMEVEAVDEGIIAKIMVEGGTEGVKVNAVIAILAEEGEDVAEAAKGGASTPAKPPSGDAQTAEVPQAPTPAMAAPSPTPKAETAPSGSKIKASPLAKRIARDGGLDIALVTGTGPNGRIIKRDVEKSLKEGVSAPMSAKGDAPKAASSAPQGMSDDAVRKLFPEGSYEELPHNGMRRVVASRLTESSQTIPSYFISMDCELDALLALRGQINKSAPMVNDKPAFKLSVNDFIIKAMALALRDVPMANASWTSDARLLHKSSDVGVAVAVPDGLFTPIVRDAQTKALSAISAEVKDMAKRARDGKLKPQEYQGGTTAVSNLGMFGVSNFTSIINPPHASIVSIGAGKQQPIVKDGALAVGTVMTATFAFDHRVIDGALGAELAKAFQTYIENPMGMLV